MERASADPPASNEILIHIKHKSRNRNQRFIFFPRNNDGCHCSIQTVLHPCFLLPVHQLKAFSVWAGVGSACTGAQGHLGKQCVHLCHPCWTERLQSAGVK